MIPSIPPDQSFTVPKNVFRLANTSYWSTVCFPEGRSYERGTMRLFQYAQGQVYSGAILPSTETETNLKISGQLPSAFTCDRVGWSIFGGSEEDRRYLAARATWAWEFNSITVIAGTPLDTYNLPVERGEISGAEFMEWETNRMELIQLLRARVPGVVLGLHCYDEIVVELPERTFFGLHLNTAPVPGRYFSAPTYVRFTLYGHERVTVPLA